MVLDEFYNQLDEIADDLLPIEFQGHPPGSFPVSAGVGVRKAD